MSILIGGRALSKAYHARPLFHDLSLAIGDGDKLGIIGPNGAGKSTLLRILAGLEEADQGEIARRRALRISYVPQTESFDTDNDVLTIVSTVARKAGVPEADIEGQAKITLGQVGFTDPEAKAGTLSGGWKKRLSLACGFVTSPDVLLLDEPTNHLDLEGILWLEKLLSSARFTFAMVSHDRAFLEKTVTKIAELHTMYPDGVFVSEGRYTDFLVKRADWLNLQTRLEETMANKARREVEWLRRGPQARSTKSKYRIDEAHELIGELSALRGRLRQGETRIDFSGTGRKTKKLVLLEDVSKTLGNRVILKNFDFVLASGMSLGILGGNGSGKTTLLKLIMKTMEPDSGKIEHADKLNVVYFDQNRGRLDPNMKLKTALTPAGGDAVIYRGKPQHVLAWARRFQFRPEQMEITVGELSGGEQARLLIAQLMLEPADVLLLDEPTNDLDIPTLEVLEESLAEFPGVVVLVTHDRYFLEQVTNLVIGLDGLGGAQLYAEYSQWQRDLQARSSAAAKAAKSAGAAAGSGSAGKKQGKLAYMEQREFDQMEATIMVAEEDLTAKQMIVDDPKLQTSASKLADACDALKLAQEKVDRLYARWSELGAKGGI